MILPHSEALTKDNGDLTYIDSANSNLLEPHGYGQRINEQWRRESTQGGLVNKAITCEARGEDNMSRLLVLRLNCLFLMSTY